MSKRYAKALAGVAQLALLLGWLMAAPASAQPPVDLALVLAADGSGSIDDHEFRLQREGYAWAITHPKVLAAIAGGLEGAIAVAFMEWGAPESQHTIVDWQIIDGARSAADFAEQLRQAPRVAFGYNSISNALFHAGTLLAGAPVFAERHVVDISGDGPQIGGRPLEAVRQALLDQGITINALVIVSPGGGVPGPGGMPLDAHYRRDVIGGPGAFVRTAAGRDELAEALLDKLILEIAGGSHDTRQGGQIHVVESVSRERE